MSSIDMRKICAIVILYSVLLLSGCSTKEEYSFPGEDAINAYVGKIFGFESMSETVLSSSIEEMFMTAIKGKVFESELVYFEPAMNGQGILADENCTIYLPIGALSSICEGKTRLYIDGELVNEYNSNDNMGNSYMLLSNRLAQKVAEYIGEATWFQESIKGKRIFIKFYITEEDWLNVISEKDPFKYLSLDVNIKE